MSSPGPYYKEKFVKIILTVMNVHLTSLPREAD